MSSSNKKLRGLIVPIIFFLLLTVMFFWAGMIGYINQGTVYTSIFDWLLQPTSWNVPWNYFYMFVFGQFCEIVFFILVIIYIKKNN